MTTYQSGSGNYLNINSSSKGNNIVQINGQTWINGVLQGAENQINGSGVLTEVTRNIEGLQDCTLICNYSPAKIQFTQSENPNVIIQAEDNIEELIIVEKKNNELWVSIKENSSFSTKNSIIVQISLKSLDAVRINGSGEFECSTGIKSDQPFYALVKGSGDITLEIQCPMLTAVVVGSGDIELSGSSEQVSYEVRGSGDIKAEDLIAITVDANIMGSGDIKVKAESHIVASIMGSGDIKCYGSAQISENVRGSGSIKRKK